MIFLTARGDGSLGGGGFYFILSISFFIFSFFFFKFHFILAGLICLPTSLHNVHCPPVCLPPYLLTVGRPARGPLEIEIRVSV